MSSKRRFRGATAFTRGFDGLERRDRRKSAAADTQLGNLESVASAALTAQRVLVDAAREAGVSIGKRESDRIRSTVVRGVYRRFLELSGVYEPVWVSLPPIPGVEDRFCGALERISVCSSELLSEALEPLAEEGDRRNRGAHFTPRSMACDIVAKTLDPLFSLVPPERTLELRVCDPAVGGGVFLLELVSQLADRLVACGRVSDLYVARRLCAIHCAYGVDIDSVSVECTKLALRLECRAHLMPTSWLDDNVKCGDGLVGLIGGQLHTGHWRLGAPRLEWLSNPVSDAIRLGADARKARMALLSKEAAL